MVHKTLRNSNLELYRVIVMILIIAHHYFVHSGIDLSSNPASMNSLYLSLFGMWGKTGINCFVLITGYFMCTSSITLKKFLKLILEIYFYKILIFIVFWICGYESISLKSLMQLAIPVTDVADNFIGCFILFWLSIPFLNILLKNLTKRQHELMLVLSLSIYVILPFLPFNRVLMNYVTWFIVLYFISSYIRLYELQLFTNRTWGYMTILLIMISMISVIVCIKLGFESYRFVSDSNAILAILVGISSFMFFKDVSVPYNKFINTLGASTFGVLLIHDNSDAMRLWLWRDTLNNIGWFTRPTIVLIAHSIISVVLIYTLCTAIDRLRTKFFEQPFFFRFGDSIDQLHNRIFASQNHSCQE